MDSSDISIDDLNKVTENMILEQLPDEMRSFCESGKSVAELAHLAKNIIQMVSGSVEIMELGLQRKQYDRVLRSWNIFEPNFIRLKKFLLDLIKYTKHYPIQKSDCDFNETIRKGIGSCEYLLKNKHVKIQLHQDKSIPVLQLDASRFEEIVRNLIIHAFDNLSDQTGNLTISSKYLEDNHQVQMIISDDGPALSKATQQQLTTPFERTRNMAGTGFEIPLSMRYAQEHNGYLEISSDEKTGNSVTAHFPI